MSLLDDGTSPWLLGAALANEAMQVRPCEAEHRARLQTS